MIGDAVNATNAHSRKTGESWIMLHLNPSTRTPPVGCPLLIQLPNGKLVRAERREWAASHNDNLSFYMPCGGLIIGRYPWAYP